MYVNSGITSDTLSNFVLTYLAGDASARFGVVPGAEGPGEGGFAEWLHAMRLVARLPAGVPQHFRRKVRYNASSAHSLVSVMLNVSSN